ncbi:uncharacterized protein LOC127749001 [Frankliniella occidentalis]|uniref:Uncharacterized protein LOC127749001 n=1 Tax=Frankliniella occidentalis TaxID=133901 RepID=A0A9C6WW73_FRAOC|nr:uncharacterized protein LOC127749001 [Frankliniella occidentalis]
MSFLLVLLAIMVKQGTLGKAINTLIGPYIAYGDRFFMCEPNLPSKWYIRASHFNPQKPKELQVLTGNATFAIPYDDGCWGVYEANNTPVDWTFPNVPVMPYGHYRLRALFGNKSEMANGCWAVHCYVIPKPE